MALDKQGKLNFIADALAKAKVLASTDAAANSTAQVLGFIERVAQAEGKYLLMSIDLSNVESATRILKKIDKKEDKDGLRGLLHAVNEAFVYLVEYFCATEPDTCDSLESMEMGKTEGISALPPSATLSTLQGPQHSILPHVPAVVPVTPASGSSLVQQASTDARALGAPQVHTSATEQQEPSVESAATQLQQAATEAQDPITSAAQLEGTAAKSPAAQGTLQLQPPEAQSVITGAVEPAGQQVMQNAMSDFDQSTSHEQHKSAGAQVSSAPGTHHFQQSATEKSVRDTTKKQLTEPGEGEPGTLQHSGTSDLQPDPTRPVDQQQPMEMEETLNIYIKEEMEEPQVYTPQESMPAHLIKFEGTSNDFVPDGLVDESTMELYRHFVDGQSTQSPLQQLKHLQQLQQLREQRNMEQLLQQYDPGNVMQQLHDLGSLQQPVYAEMDETPEGCPNLRKEDLTPTYSSMNSDTDETATRATEEDSDYEEEKPLLFPMIDLNVPLNEEEEDIESDLIGAAADAADVAEPAAHQDMRLPETRGSRILPHRTPAENGTNFLEQQRLQQLQLQQYYKKRLQQSKKATKQLTQGDFTCSKCGRQFESAGGLFRHAKVHKGFQCPVCHKHMDSITGLEKHVGTVHGDIPAAAVAAAAKSTSKSAAKSHANSAAVARRSMPSIKSGEAAKETPKRGRGRPPKNRASVGGVATTSAVPSTPAATKPVEETMASRTRRTTQYDASTVGRDIPLRAVPFRHTVKAGHAPSSRNAHLITAVASLSHSQLHFS